MVRGIRPIKRGMLAPMPTEGIGRDNSHEGFLYEHSNCSKLDDPQSDSHHTTNDTAIYQRLTRTNWSASSHGEILAGFSHGMARSKTRAYLFHAKEIKILRLVVPSIPERARCLTHKHAPRRAR